jgi:hypothetical protein
MLLGNGVLRVMLIPTDAFHSNLGLVVKTHDETKLGSLSNDPDLAELLGGGENDIQQT